MLIDAKEVIIISDAKMSSIKDRNGMNLTEAEDIEMARIHRRTVQKRSSTWGRKESDMTERLN